MVEVKGQVQPIRCMLGSYSEAVGKAPLTSSIGRAKYANISKVIVTGAEATGRRIDAFEVIFKSSPVERSFALVRAKKKKVGTKVHARAKRGIVVTDS